MVRLPDLPHDHPDFLRAYAEAKEAQPKRSSPHAEGMVCAACLIALRSDAYQLVSRAYRTMINRHSDEIREQIGSLPLGGIRSRNIDVNVSSATAKQHRLKVWRFMFKVWKEMGKVERNYAADAKSVRMPKTTPHPPWTNEEISAYRSLWPIGTPARACFELLLWTGARISDAVRIGPGMIESDGAVAYTQQKTGGMAYAPWSNRLPAYIACEAPERDQMHQAIACLSGHMTFLATTAGKTRSSNSLGEMIRARARDAGVEKSAHDLRKTRAIRLMEAGGSPHQIGAWTGHESLKEIEEYTADANRRRAVLGTEQDQNGVQHTLKRLK